MRTTNKQRLTIYSDAEQFKHEIDLELFLEKAGKRKCSGGNYYVPWRETPGKNRTPSLSVIYFPQVGWQWRDWGTDEYGDIFDLVEKLYDIKDSKEKIKKILDVWYDSENNQNQQIQKQYQKPQTQTQKRPQRIKWIQTFEPQIVAKALAYLQDERNIPKMIIDMAVGANFILAFVVYKIFNSQNKQIGYGVGFPNLSDGFNIRSIIGDYKYATTQDITVFYLNTTDKKMKVNHDAIPDILEIKKIIITESVIDALSCNRILEHDKAFYISLNSTANKNKLFSFLEKFSNSSHTIYSMLDNDKAGNKTTSELMDFCENKGLNFQDYRSLYKKFKDPNEYIQNMKRSQTPQLTPDMEPDELDEAELNCIIRKYGHAPARAPEPF